MIEFYGGVTQLFVNNNKEKRTGNEGKVIQLNFRLITSRDKESIYSLCDPSDLEVARPKR